MKAAAPCSVPLEDLADHLNGMPGPHLTVTDVAQRMRALKEDDTTDYPDDRLREGCLEVFAWKKAEGTELPAIVGALQEHVEAEEQRLDTEHRELVRAADEAKRRELGDRFLAGADCKWTPVERSKALFCRMNGRAYRLEPTPDGPLELHRIEAIDDAGVYVGRYRGRTDATSALGKVAYAPDLLRR